ncbi:MAG: hypothetical protein AAF546_15355 [Verrucomicrobiota bacterium]
MNQLIEKSSVIAIIAEEVEGDSKIYHLWEILKKDDSASFPYEMADEYRPETPIPRSPINVGKTTDYVIFMSGPSAELKCSYGIYDSVVLVDGPQSTLQDLREGIEKLKQIDRDRTPHR